MVPGAFDDFWSSLSTCGADRSYLQGMQAQITKAVLSQALLFGIKDLLEACALLAAHSLELMRLTHSVLQTLSSLSSCSRGVAVAPLASRLLSEFDQRDVVLFPSRATRTKSERKRRSAVVSFVLAPPS